MAGEDKQTKVEEARRLVAEAEQEKARRCQVKFQMFAKHLLEKDGMVLDVAVELQPSGGNMFVAIPRIVFRPR